MITSERFKILHILLAINRINIPFSGQVPFLNSGTYFDIEGTKCLSKLPWQFVFPNFLKIRIVISSPPPPPSGFRTGSQGQNQDFSLEVQTKMGRGGGLS